MEHINSLTIYNFLIWRNALKGNIDYEKLEAASSIMCYLDEDCELGHNIKSAIEEATESIDKLLVVQEFLMESRRICMKKHILNEALEDWVQKEYLKQVSTLSSQEPFNIMVACDCLLNTELYYTLPRSVEVEGAVRALILNEQLSEAAANKLLIEVLPKYTNIM